MRARITLLVAPLVLVLAACGGGDPSGYGSAASAPPPVSADSSGVGAWSRAPSASAPANGAGDGSADGREDAGNTSAGTSGGASDRDSGIARSRRTAPRIAVQVVESDLGRILADSSGRTLYAFTKDKDGASNCDADCVAEWPALISPGEVTAGKGVDKSLLRQDRQGGGISQAVYGEWPLYYYVGDAGPGETNGQGLDDEWFAVAPDGKLVRTDG
ncbi:hypothetical protein V1L54_16620 [Streptomyces sp. TRM 70361]|uniref:COG4315 family predicted lipoprotein n=1 Tax=Streptomyces sp. TRM 70361 TaxID=3116553 RepID=UPI002E7BA7C1|nr:hypothetical protein [Streptomyces sp. TRM 70361]MEE1941006.1 hypothetical protein [Streptomyces sp. TRM 70361]